MSRAQLRTHSDAPGDRERWRRDRRRSWDATVALFCLLGLNGCAGLAPEVIAVNRLVYADGGVFQALAPLMTVSESALELRVTRVRLEANQPLLVSVPADAHDVYLVHGSEASMWGKFRLSDRGSASAVDEVLMETRPLSAMLAWFGGSRAALAR